MSREPEAVSTSALAAAASKFSRLASGARIGASSSKYRIPDSISNAPGEPPSAHAAAANTRLSVPNVTTFASSTKRSSTTRPRSIQLSSSSKHLSSVDASERSSVEAADEDRERTSQHGGRGSTVGEGKLPQKLRHHISRLRLQEPLSPTTSGPSSPTNASSKLKGASPSPPRSLTGSRASRSGKRTSIVSSLSLTTPKYSRQSQKIQLLHEVMKMQASTARTSKISPQRRKSSAQLGREGDTKSIPFFDLLRPLQSSLSCASLMSEWPSEDENSDEDVLESEEQQSERGRSRMLRICCSLDNLLLSIGDRVQKEKLDAKIVRGASRELAQLFQYAVKQVASAAFGDEGQGGVDNVEVVVTGLSPQRRSKEAQYAFEFLEEVAERFGKLDSFVRTTLLDEIAILEEQVAALQAECDTIKQHNAQLQTEMSDLHDFHAQNGITSLSLRGPDQSREGDDEALGLELPLKSNQREGESELEMTKKQCKEYERLLEMAKQEIRLSHHERDVHKAHVAELSSALFKDSELSMLRNQLQSEKKRVKALEMENIALLECQHDQSLKIQSLLMNKAHPTTSTSATMSVSNAHHGIAKLAGPAENAALENSSSADSSTDERKSVILPSDSAPISVSINTCLPSQTSALAGITKNVHDAPSVCGADDEGCPHWFSRLMINVSRSDSSDADATRVSKVGKMVAALPPQILQQIQTRRQVNVPTIPPSSLGLRSSSLDNSRPRSSSKRRKLKMAATAEAVTGEVDMVELEHSCRCLIWFFFQRFHMVQEADRLSESPLFGDYCTIGGATTFNRSCRTSLHFVIYHFFLERAPNDREAIADLSDFVHCLQLCRQESFEVDLFCSFLDGRRHHDDLNFLLWVLQAVNDTEVGISYDECTMMPASTSSDSKHERKTRYVCVLKAIFVVRAVFRLLRFKSTGSTSTTAATRKARPHTAPSRSASSSSLLKPVSPLSPSKRKQKSRTGDDLLGDQSKDQPKPSGVKISSSLLADRAATALRSAIELNHGRPVTLEVFNQLLLQFAVVPSAEELALLLGPFYHATDDEKKVPWDVFITLLLEMYRFQSKWQREQLRALFMHLHWQNEVDERAAAKRKADELALLAASTKKRAGSQNDAAEEKIIKKKKMKHKQRTLAHGRLDIDADLDAKYLRGITRPLLSELLSKSGIIDNQAHIDIDWLLVRMLDVANASAAEIHFEAVYEALRVMRLVPDWSLRVQTITHSEQFRADAQGDFAYALQSQWRSLTSVSIALCENDPNAFVRKQSQQWLQQIESHIDRMSKLPLDAGGSSPWHVIESIRALLSFGWRLASVRSRDSFLRRPKQSAPYSAVETCFTEFYFADRAVRATIDSLTGFDDSEVSISVSVKSEASAVKLHGSLERFYDTSAMPSLTAPVSFGTPNGLACDAESMPAIRGHLEHVLQRYSVHFANLYARYETAAYNYSPGVTLHLWRQMAYELSLIHSRYLTPFRLQQLFLSVANPVAKQNTNECGTALDVDDLVLNQTQFVELFVVVAFELHRGVVTRHRKRHLLRGPNASISTKDRPHIDDIWRPLLADSVNHDGGRNHHPAHVLSLFLHELIVRMAIRNRSTPHEVGFSQKLTCPLVGRALLEHRPFLRSVFFYYAKQDEDAADLLAASNPPGAIVGQPIQSVPVPVSSSNASQTGPSFHFQLEKTKRNSMSFDEFQMFLGEFDLVHEATTPSNSMLMLSLKDARRVFETVMAVDNDDDSQLEFDEFAGAIVALAVYFAPDPFTLWHEKIHAFVSSLKRCMREDDVRLQY